MIALFLICRRVFSYTLYYNLFLYIGFLSIINSVFVNAQTSTELNSDKTIKHQIGLRHDNDFITFKDRYYSSGLFLSFGIKLEHGVFNSGHEQLMFSLNQEIYTPSDTETTNILEMDRPYAGFLGLTVGWAYSKNSNGFDLNAMAGVAGKASGAGDFQRWYHNALVIFNQPTWNHEISNSFHFNLYGQYSHEWQLVTGNFSVYLAAQPKFALGTKNIYAYPELITYFGKRNTMGYSSAYNKIGSKDRELFFALRAGYRLIAHNAMLEGHLFGDNSPFLVKPKTGIFYAGIDLQHRNGQNAYWIGYRFNTAETAETKSHKYIVLSYSRSF